MSLNAGTSAPPCFCSHGGHDHALIRCGCSNERAHSHGDPLQHADDAFHRVWCCLCMNYCSKDAHCPLPLPSAAIIQNSKRSSLLLFKLPYQLLSIPFYLFASIRSWLGNSFGRLAGANKQPMHEKAY